MAGNPQEIASRQYVETLQRWLEPQDKRWFAYNIGHRPAMEAAAQGLSAELGIDFEPDDVMVCRGAHHGLAAALNVIVDAGEEVVFISPPWFFYEAMILAVGAEPVRVQARQTDWDLDVDAIRRAITDNTRAVLINTPNNPTGRVYPPETLKALADVLETSSQRRGRPIYIISDEAYSRILFSGTRMHTPAAYYPRSLLIHTYSKSSLAPGQRLGYVALPPGMPDRELLRIAFLASGAGTGHIGADAVMAYALADIDRMNVDMEAMERRRDRMVSALQEMGYQLQSPEATFYLLVKSPVVDEMVLADRLARDDVYVLPGTAFEMPGYFRISLTATDKMVERALPVFAAAMEEQKAAIS
jgi:aspartate aminotransferase